MEFYVTSTGIRSSQDFALYDTSRYDLVEKKDTKANKLKEELDWLGKQKNKAYECIKTSCLLYFSIYSREVSSPSKHLFHKSKSVSYFPSIPNEVAKC